MSLLFSCPRIYSNTTALSLSEMEHVIDINNNSYVYATPEVTQNIKHLKTLIKPEYWTATLAQITDAFDAQKSFITLQTMQAALAEALAIINHPFMPSKEESAIKLCLENYAQDIESGKALVSIEQEDTPQYRKSCTTPTRIGIFCDLLVKQNLNVRGTVKINNLNGILQATDGIISTSSNIQLEGDVTGTQNNTVVSSVCGVPACDLVNIVNSGTPLNEPNTLVLRDNTGSFAAQNITMDGSTSIGGSATVGGNAAIVGSLSAGLNISTAQDVIVGRNIDLITNPSTATAGNILKNSTIFIHNVGTENTGLGIGALNPTANLGVDNTALGHSSLNANTAGDSNTAIGAAALAANVSGDGNTALGRKTLEKQTSGDNNVAVGLSALLALNGGSNNIAVGTAAGSAYTGTETGNILIGNNGTVTDSGTIRIGSAAGPSPQTRAFVAGIAAAGTVPAAVLRKVQVDINTGQLLFDVAP